MVRGDRSDPGNPFRWDKIILNLHGDLINPQQILGCQSFEGGIKNLPETLSPMWINP